MLSVRRSDLDWAADGVQLGLGWWCTTARLGLGWSPAEEELVPTQQRILPPVIL